MQFNVLIYLNIVVSISAGILSAGVSNYSGNENWLDYGIISFLGTFAVYNLQRIAKLKYHYSNEWMNWVSRHAALIFSLAVCTLIGASLLLFFRTGIEWRWWYYHSFFLIIAIFYVYRLKGKNLREIPGIKILLIALTWVYVLYFFPALNEGLEPNWIVSIALTLYVIAVTIPFDIRDLSLDEPWQMTLPQLIGVKNSKYLAISLIITSYALFAFEDPVLCSSWLYTVSVIAHVLLIAFVNERSGDRYVAGFIDGVISLTGLMFLFS